jgi:hypothetical protein
MLHSPIERARRGVAAERRAAERHPVHIRSVMMDVTMSEEAVTVLNISTTGFLAEATGKFQIGSVVTVQLPAIGSKTATIRWCGNGVIGCEFEAYIEEAPFLAAFNSHFRA